MREQERRRKDADLLQIYAIAEMLNVSAAGAASLVLCLYVDPRI